MSKGKSGLFQVKNNRVGSAGNSTGIGSSNNEIRAPDQDANANVATENGNSEKAETPITNSGPPTNADKTGSTGTGNSSSDLPDETMESGACDHVVIGKIFADRDLSVEDATAHKLMLMNMTARDYEQVLKKQGFVVHGIKKSNIGSHTGWKVNMDTCDNKGAKLNGVFVHHAVASHGAPYIKFSTTHGKIKVVDNRNATYDDRDEKNTILIFLKDL